MKIKDFQDAKNKALFLCMLKNEWPSGHELLTIFVFYDTYYYTKNDTFKYTYILKLLIFILILVLILKASFPLEYVGKWGFP
jgi:hypothetical protein